MNYLNYLMRLAFMFFCNNIVGKTNDIFHGNALSVGKLEPNVWQFVAFAYDSIKNLGTFHINYSFGYFDESSSPKEQPVSKKCIIQNKKNDRSY